MITYFSFHSDHDSVGVDNSFHMQVGSVMRREMDDHDSGIRHRISVQFVCKRTYFTHSSEALVTPFSTMTYMYTARPGSS